MKSKRILELIYPSNIYCICCGNIIDHTRHYALCDKCVRLFHWANKRTCGKCGKILADDYRYDLCYQCRETEYCFEKGFCCVQYGLYEKNCVLSFKYGGNAYMGEKLGQILYDRISCEELDIDLILPIPMHRKKEQIRGFNQAALMAKELAVRLRVPYNNRILLRVRQTAPMSRISALERRENMEGAIAIAKGQTDILCGKTILLIDDIFTTGSTADACSSVLMSVGVKAVYVLVFAAGANVKHTESAEDKEIRI